MQTKDQGRSSLTALNMNANFCSKKLEELTLVVQSQPPLVLFIAVVNFFFSPVTMFGNVLVIHALWKASSIPTTLKKLFLNLALTDLAIGLFIQPMSAVILAVVLSKITNGNNDFDCFCPYVISADMYPTYFLAGSSFFTIAAIAMDRLLALLLHLRYNHLVTEKRVGIGLVLLWLSSGLVIVGFLTLPSHNEIIAVAVNTAGLILITVAYIRIYKVVRYHQNRIQCQNHIQNNETIIAVREKKSALNAFYVFIVSLACYVPHLFARSFLAIDILQMSSLGAYYVSSVLIFFNSTLNPFIYCWRYREIRNIVKNTLKKIFIKNYRT